MEKIKLAYKKVALVIFMILHPRIPYMQYVYENKRWLAQKLIDLILKMLGMAIVANYVAEKKLVQLEIVPSYLLKNRRDEMEAYKQIMEGEGDKISDGK